MPRRAPQVSTARLASVARRHRLRRLKWSPAYGTAPPRKELETPPSRWKHLARITQPVGVERGLDPQHLAHVVLAKDQRHQVLLFQADAVFAAQRTAGRRAHAHDL